MKDFLYRGTVEDLNACFTYTVATGAAAQAILAHNCDPVSGHILGCGLTIGALCVPLLQDDERLTLRWHYRGALQSLVVDAGAGSDVRGFINPTDLRDRVEAKDELYGESCQVSAVRSTKARVISSGTTLSIMRNVAEDAAFLFSTSDQIETGMVAMIGLNPDPENPVKLAQGLLLQALPGCDLERFDSVRQRLHLEPVRNLLGQCPETDNYFERILDAVLGEHARPDQVAVHECAPPRFECHCSEHSLGAVLRFLSPEDRREIIAKGDDVVVNCHFCSRRYAIPVPRFQELLAADETGDADA